METPKQRTERMLLEERQKVLEHEEAARANRGKRQVPLRKTLIITVPLVAMVFTLYTCSFLYTRKLRSIFNESLLSVPNEAQNVEAPINLNENTTVFDDEFLMDDQKSW